jgi:nitric oxide reductase subunit C
MLTKSQARLFFIAGTILFSGLFLFLTVDTVGKVPEQTKQENITEQVRHGKDLWDKNNCMGCHTLLGEGAYYAPELTKVIERRGDAYVKAVLQSPVPWGPNGRKMVKYEMNEADATAMVEFFKWIGNMDLNGFEKAVAPKTENK